MTVPQVLLPVIPHLTSELHSEDGAKRLEAATLLGRLLSLPGNRLVNEYRDVLDALLRRYSDTQVRGGGSISTQRCWALLVVDVYLLKSLPWFAASANDQ
jgi:hypothetical protein